MKKNNYFIHTKQVLSGAKGAGLALALIASLGICAPALAKKGGNGGGGSGGGGEPPATAPFLYNVTWFGIGSNDVYHLVDVAPDGTVVGNKDLNGVWGDRRALICFADGSEINLHDLLVDAGAIPPGWMARTAFRISDDLLIGVDIYDDLGRLHTGALQLNADGSFGDLELFSDPGGGNAAFQDVSESGDFLIFAGDDVEAAGGPSVPAGSTQWVWNPKSGLLREITVAPVNYWATISEYGGGTFFVEDTLYDFDSNPIANVPDPGKPFRLRDLSADGTVVATIDGTHHRRDPDIVAHWRPGMADWEPIVNAGFPASPTINGAGEIAGKGSAGIFVFHDDYGVQLVDDLIDPTDDSGDLSLWSSSNPSTVWSISDPLTGQTTGGVILGKTSSGVYFTLTPQ